MVGAGGKITRRGMEYAGRRSRSYALRDSLFVAFHTADSPAAVIVAEVVEGAWVKAALRIKGLVNPLLLLLSYNSFRLV